MRSSGVMLRAATKSGNSAPGWTAVTNISGHTVIVYERAYPHTGTNYASEGGYKNDDDALTQTVTIPSNIGPADVLGKCGDRRNHNFY